MTPQPIVIVGAGLAGLRCARELTRAGHRVRLLEAADRPGGRVHTETIDGHLCDRGFQVYLDAYPEGRSVLDYESLDLRSFYNGALVRFDGRFHRAADPTRAPFHALRAAFSPLVTLGDPIRIAKLAKRWTGGKVEDVWKTPETTALEALREAGLSDRVIERFFRPFFGGVFFDHELRTSSRMLAFCLRMFATGRTVLPARGMQQIPDQLAAGLPEGTLSTGRRVTSLDPAAGSITLTDGETIESDAIVLATDGTEAAHLSGVGQPTVWQSTTTAWFACDQQALPEPMREPILLLNGQGPDDGPVNHACAPSSVCPRYAPKGRATIACSTTADDADATDEQIEQRIRGQMRNWFGGGVDDWQTLKIHRIAHALPRRFANDPESGSLEPPERPVRLRDRLYACGDHLDNNSTNGALASGRRAAEALLADLGKA